MKSQTDFKKCTVYRFGSILNYGAGLSEVQSIFRKTTGELSAVMINTDQYLNSPILPFEIYVHVMEGKIETVIDGQSLFIQAGEFLIIPAHTRHTSRALVPTKLLQLTIKSGYEQII